jgi:carboxymethylenebutenolidase
MESRWVQFSSGEEFINGYLSVPGHKSLTPAILIIHEVFGLTAHFEELTTRFAREGYVTLAIDLYCRDEKRIKSFSDRHELTQFVSSLNQDQMMNDASSTVGYLKHHPLCNKSIGVVGYCMGGAISMNLAASNVPLDVAVVYYGRNPEPIDKVRNIKVPLLAFYGENDWLMEKIPALREKLDQYGKEYELYTYPGADHAFFNDTRENYHAQAAQDSSNKTQVFLRRYLS